MRTLRLSLAGTLILALLGGTSGAVLAQMDADAETVYVTLVSDEPVSGNVGSVSETVTLYSSRDGEDIGMLEFTDPRVSGKWTTAWNADIDSETGHGIMWGTVRIENQGGTWEGPFSGIEYQPPEGDLYTLSGWLAGDGEHAGYTFFFQLDAFQHGGPARTWHGVIYKGQPPAAE